MQFFCWIFFPCLNKLRRCLADTESHCCLYMRSSEARLGGEDYVEEQRMDCVKMMQYRSIAGDLLGSLLAGGIVCSSVQMKTEVNFRLRKTVLEGILFRAGE
jgi:hypothetical protein